MRAAPRIPRCEPSCESSTAWVASAAEAPPTGCPWRLQANRSAMLKRRPTRGAPGLRRGIVTPTEALTMVLPSRPVGYQRKSIAQAGQRNIEIGAGDGAERLPSRPPACFHMQVRRRQDGELPLQLTRNAADGDARPNSITKEQHCAQGDAGCGPHRRNVITGKRSGKADLSGDKICGKNAQYPNRSSRQMIASGRWFDL